MLKRGDTLCGWDEDVVWLTGVVVCLVAAPSVQLSLVQAT